MSQASGGKSTIEKEMAERTAKPQKGGPHGQRHSSSGSASGSKAITATQSAAAAFGEDIADDTYSVSELSHLEDEERAKRVKGRHPSLPAGESSMEAFLRTTLSRAAAGFDLVKSYAEEETGGGGTSSSNSPPSAGHNGQPESRNHLSTNASQHQQHHQQQRSSEGSTSDGGAGSDDTDTTLSSESSFLQFARTRFHLKGTTHAYSCAALPHPLLAKEDRADFLASLAAWVMILRIMGDLPDRDTTETLQLAGEQPPVISIVRANYRTKFTKKDVEEAHNKYSDLFKDPTGADMQGVPFLPDRCDSMLDKVQYVIALGIYRPQLRDELYCQLCKQLTNNPSRNSSVRGWVLLTLFVGSFAPSERFAVCFNGFIQEGPQEFAYKVDRLLRRTCVVGTRGYPPSWLEFQACKNNKPLLVPITFMNGYRTLVEVDSASTVQELVNSIAEKVGLHDAIGFSVYVTLHTKISCLGHGMHRVMDAISECEQHTRQMGMRESSSLWRLYFRREYFAPWRLAEGDQVNTDLIYQQVMRGVSLGEYKCEKEEVLILLAAQKFYIESQNSADLRLERLDMFVRNWLTQEMLQKHQPMFYVDKVREALQKNFLESKPDHQALKNDIVVFAKDKWFLIFSRFYDAPKVVGPGLVLSKVVVAVNNKGIYILDEVDTIRMHLAFWEVATVLKGRQQTTVRTLKGDDYTVGTSHSEDLYTLLTNFLYGLRMRSCYAVVTQDTTAQQEGGNNVTVMRGELLVLSQPYSDSAHEVVVSGTCKRISVTCRLPRDRLYVMACTEEPSADMLGRVLGQLRRDPGYLVNDLHPKPHTLQQYARLHFRPTTESAVGKLLTKASFRRDKTDTLWQFTKDVLKKPLLRRSFNKEELRRPACRAFSAIQQYMGDLNLKQEVTDAELANDYILDPARRNKYLRDEIFCQLMKQLTNNPNKASVEKGWVLMTLLCSTTIPSGDLYDQCLSFFRGANCTQGRACADLITAQKSSGSRLFPPHLQEHEMISRQQPNVRVQVMMPSGAPVTVEVGCRSRVSEVKRAVKKRLRLRSVAEYSLFLSGTDSLHSLPDRSFYFDCLTQAQHFWLRHVTPEVGGASGGKPDVGVVMLKKIWVNVTPGEDPEADKYFHFPQEVPNFVRGYHQCSHKQVVELAALLYRTRFADDLSHLRRHFPEMAPTLLPREFSDSSSLDNIKQEVEQQHAQDKGMSQDEARAHFLQVAVTWPTYGCVFFEVKQRVMKTLPKYCLLAINTSGVHILDLHTKELVQTYDFNKIPNWAFDDNSFTIIITDNNGGSSRLLMETSVGHNVDDVLMSHISWVMNSQMKRKHGFYNNVGESFC